MIAANWPDALKFLELLVQLARDSDIEAVQLSAKNLIRSLFKNRVPSKQLLHALPEADALFIRLCIEGF